MIIVISESSSNCLTILGMHDLDLWADCTQTLNHITCMLHWNILLLFDVIFAVLTMAEDIGVSMQESIFRKKTKPFQPLVVIEFSAGAKQAAIEWIVAKIQMPRSQGGADLDVNATVLHQKQVSRYVVFFIPIFIEYI